MNAKKILMQAARKQHRKEIQQMTEAQAAGLLRNLTDKKEDK